MQVLGHPLGDVVLSVLLGIAACGFAWMGVWGLRGRDTHLPWNGQLDGVIWPPKPEELDTPLRGRAAKLAGGGFLIVAAIALEGVLRIWL
jgi:hypothetical protein